MPTNKRGRGYRKRGEKYELRREFYISCSTLREYRLAERRVRSVFAKLKDDLRTDVAPCCTIRGKLDEFLDDRTSGFGPKNCNDRSAARLRRRLLMFDKAFHSAPLDAIHHRDVENWMKRRLKKPLRGKSVNRDTVNADVVALKGFAAWAQWKGYAPEVLSLLLAKRFHSPGKLPGKNRKPPKVMNIHLLLDLIDKFKAVRRDVGLFFHGMLLLNLRPSDAADLRMSDVRLPRGDSGGDLTVRRVKTFGEFVVPFESGSVLHRWILECIGLAKGEGRPVTGSAPLIICIGGKSRLRPGGWTTANLDRVAAQLCGECGAKFTPYLIRHSITSWVIKQPGVGRGAVQAYAGHAKGITTDIYIHVTAADALPARQAVERLIKSRVSKTG